MATPAAESFAGWLLKTRMSFYQDDALDLPWFFGLFCWNYAIAGAAMLWMEPKWVHQPQSLLGGQVFPYRQVAWLLICVQSPLSFLADYVHMTRDSYWHVVDRLLALPLMGLELTRLVLLTHRSCRPAAAAMPLPLVGLHLLAAVLAVYSFGQSTAAQSTLDRRGFVLWHNLWHLYPVLASLLIAGDFYLCGGWKRSSRRYIYRAEWHLLKKSEGLK